MAMPLRPATIDMRPEKGVSTAVSAEERTASPISVSTRVASVMHRGVITCSPEFSGSTVARIMAAHRIHSVVVTAPGSLPRVVTDAEIAAALYAGTLGTSTAEELAKPSPLVRPSDTLAYAIERMHECETTHAVVARRPIRPLGVVSVLDLAEAIYAGGDVR
jgi:CBS domain-containing protein